MIRETNYYVTRENNPKRNVIRELMSVREALVVYA